MVRFPKMMPPIPRLAAAALALIAGGLVATSARAQVAISVQIAPPILPVYVQPPMPDVGYLWTPGYWANNGQGYYWVPGTWVQPPQPGLLWTPPYWGWEGGAYLFHAGYWGPHVGFYGGVNYGFGYGGVGYQGGRWQDGHLVYNRTVNNFGGVHVTAVYSRPIKVTTTSRVSYVGGDHGLRVQPGAAEHRVEGEPHSEPTAEQVGHLTAASQRPELAAAQNRGHPPVAATAHVGQFEGPGVVAARGVPRQAAAHPAAPAHSEGEHRP